MLAGMILGAEAVQIGSRFVASEESSAHQNFKQAVLETSDGDTILTLKELAPVRLIKNAFYQKLQKLYQTCPDLEQIKQLLGRGRAKLGMFEGDLEEGELEIGQVASIINDVKPAGEIIREIIDEYYLEMEELQRNIKYRF
jgi:enoyl-[acyl-carrier protein] reductase II